jgi:hypothetical protein
MAHPALTHELPHVFDKAGARAHLFQGPGCGRRWEHGPRCSRPAEMCTSDANPTHTCIDEKFTWGETSSRGSFSSNCSTVIHAASECGSRRSVLDSSTTPSCEAVSDEDEGSGGAFDDDFECSKADLAAARAMYDDDFHCSKADLAAARAVWLSAAEPAFDARAIGNREAHVWKC